ncbi:MAG: DUF362 domain-containing protein [Nitrospiraceae bacterium]|nr:DUF362 domain-containing protein [Nitrospiraceae bacterium]
MSLKEKKEAKRVNVYFASARVLKWKEEESLPGKLDRLLKKMNLPGRFKTDEWVAVKTHFGSVGAHRIIRPVFLAKVVSALKRACAKPFVTDTVRINGLDYLEIANQNGINHLSVGAPVILADGLYGRDSILVKAGDILGEIAVASLIHDAPAMVVCSHVKGHINSGYAGAIKNLAMGGVSASHRGCGWKCGRGAMHSIGEGKLFWDEEKCTLCYQCEEVCPLECISFDRQGKEKFQYADERCWRCGRCTRVCPGQAIVHEQADPEQFMQGLAEAAQAVMSTFEPGKVIFINFLTDIQPECDCMPGADVPVIQDKGILVSDDLVAVEQATIDMLLGSAPLPESAASDGGLKQGDDILLELHKKDYRTQIAHAQKLGLGSPDYELIRI